MPKKKIEKQKNKFKWVTAVVVAVFLLSLVPTLITYSESSTKYLDKRVVYAVDSIFARLPLLPKTPRQILVRSAQVNRDLDSYKFSAVLTMDGGETKIADISSSGSVTAAASEESRSQVQIKGKTLLPIKADFDLETYTAGKTFFFKVNKGVSLADFNTENLKGWYQLDLDSLQKNLKVDVRTEEEIIADMREQFNTYVDNELSKGSIGDRVKVKSLAKDGKDYFELELVIGVDPITKSIVGDKNSQGTKATVVIEKSTYYISELRLKPVKDSEINLNLTYKMSDQNRKVELTQPEGAKMLNNPVEVYLLFTGGAEPTAENLLKAFGGEVKEVTTTLLTIERLTKVILLLPKSL